MDAEYIEVWKDIPEYEGLYQVSNMGRVKSIGYGEERILKPGKLKKGYLQVILFKDGKQKHFQVHRLVALAFIQNPLNLPQVNHKNEDKTDNRVSNLEFCTNLYNVNYGTRNERIIKSKSKPVAQYTLDGIFVGMYHSITEAARQGFKQPNISQCCNGKLKTYKNYIWKWVDE